jgi:hypothetical protein
MTKNTFMLLSLFFLYCSSPNPKDSITPPPPKKSPEAIKCDSLINEFKQIGNSHKSLTNLCNTISNDTFYSNWKIEWLYILIGKDPFWETGAYGKIPGHYYFLSYKSQKIFISIKAIIDGDVIKEHNLFDLCKSSKYHSLYVNKYEIHKKETL